jgi:hypothetical protein
MPTTTLFWAVPLSDAIAIGEVIRVSGTQENLKLGYPTLRDATFKRMVADVRVVYGIKNVQTNDVLKVSFIALGDSSGPIINGPTFFEPKTNGVKYLMFLRQDENREKELVAISDPYDSPCALIELSPESKDLEDARWRAESCKKAIHDFSEALLTLEPREEISAIVNHFYCVEYYEYLKFIIEDLQKGSAGMIKRFKEHCEWTAEMAPPRPDARKKQKPGPGWESDYPDGSFWWFDSTKK